jgi:hypothetical protein
VRGRGGRTHAGSAAAAIADLIAGLDSAESCLLPRPLLW